MGRRISDADGLVPAALKEADLFAAWPDEVRDKLSAAAQLWEYGKGEAVTEVGSDPQGIYVIVSGALLNERSWANGKRILMGILRPGWALKLAATWDGYEHPHGLTARVDSTVILIPRAAFLDAVRGNAELISQITDFVCYQYRAELTRINIITCGSIRLQIAAFLIFYLTDAQLVLQDVPPSPEQYPIRLADVTQEELSAICGYSRQEVNRVMKSMIDEGILRRVGRLVEVVRYDLLLECLEEDEPLSDEWRQKFAAWQESVAISVDD